MITLESACCKAAAGAAGQGAERHYVCSSCGKRCLAATICTYPGTDRERWELAEMIRENAGLEEPVVMPRPGRVADRDGR